MKSTTGSEKNKNNAEMLLEIHLIRDYTRLTFLLAVAGTGLAAGLERCKQRDWCENLLCGQTGVTAPPGEGCEGQKGSLQDTVWVVFSEMEVQPFKLNWGLGL